MRGACENCSYIFEVTFVEEYLVKLPFRTDSPCMRKVAWFAGDKAGIFRRGDREQLLTGVYFERRRQTREIANSARQTKR